MEDLKTDCSPERCLVRFSRDAVYKGFKRIGSTRVKNRRTLAILGVEDLNQMKTHLEKSKKVWNNEAHLNDQIMEENQEPETIYNQL